jgi:predicted alpha/beta-hydrolase family hydrolase
MAWSAASSPGSKTCPEYGVPATTSIAFRDGDGVLDRSAAWQVPPDSNALWVLAHGAGAPLDHATMRAIADACERARIATLRFNFPFMQAGRRRVDPPGVAVAAVKAAVDAALAALPSLPCYAGGHSFGGRMGSHAAPALAGIRGLILSSFPLHPAGKPDTRRAAHLGEVALPMLFVSGTRDALAERDLLAGVVDRLPRARLHWLDGADHGYRVPRRHSDRTVDVFEEIASTVRAFVDETGDPTG